MSEQPPKRRDSTLSRQSSTLSRISRSGSDLGKPRKRKSVLVRKGQYQVKTGLLGMLFFPHHTATDAKGRKVKHHHAEDLPQAEEEDEEASWKNLTFDKKIAKFIQGRKFQTVMLLLLLLDVALVIAEIIILTHQECHLTVPHNTTHHAHADISNASVYEVPAHCHHAKIIKFRIPAEHRHHDDGKDYIFTDPPGCPITINHGLDHTLHTVEQILVWCSRVILWIFGLELIVLALCLRIEFITHPLYLLDVFVVYVSIGLDIWLWVTHVEEPWVGFIVLVRCWRFARILHGVGMSVHEVDEYEFEDEEEELKEEYEKKILALSPSTTIAMDKSKNEPTDESFGASFESLDLGDDNKETEKRPEDEKDKPADK